jgi:hypothetical protein
VTQPVWDAVSMADGWRVELAVEDHDAFHRAWTGCANAAARGMRAIAFPPSSG